VLCPQSPYLKYGFREAPVPAAAPRSIDVDDDVADLGTHALPAGDETPAGDNAAADASADGE